MHATRTMLPWSALSIPPAIEPPRRFVLVLAGVEDFAHICGGLVLHGETFLYDESADDDPSLTFRPPLEAIEDGLFDEDIFGELALDERGRPSLVPRFHEHPHDRPQARRFGSIVLPSRVRSPWAIRCLADAQAGPSLGVVPVLPPAFRPTFEEGGQVFSSDFTMHYRRIINRGARLRRLRELAAPVEILEHETELLQQAVNALVTDDSVRFGVGEDEVWVSDPEEIAERIAMGDHPAGEMLSLRGWLSHVSSWKVTAWIDDQLADNADLLSVERWPAAAHEWRTMITAACLEMVPLTADGSLDLDRVARTRTDHFVHAVHDVMDDVFTSPLGVWHTSESPEAHIDVHMFSVEQESRVLLVTSGMSRRAMAEGLVAVDEPFVELACLLPAASDETTRKQMCLQLWRLAHYPFRVGTHLAERHTVELEEPLAEGSELRGWVMTGCDLPWASSLQRALPMRPRVLLAVGLTGRELSHGVVSSRDDVLKIAAELGGVTDLRRGSRC